MGNNGAWKLNTRSLMLSVGSPDYSFTDPGSVCLPFILYVLMAQYPSTSLWQKVKHISWTEQDPWQLQKVCGACIHPWQMLDTLLRVLVSRSYTVPWYSFSFQRWVQIPRHWNSQGFSVLFHVSSTTEVYQVADMACSNRKQLTSNLIGHEWKVCVELALRHEVAYCLKKYKLSRENMLREEIKLRRMRRLLWEEKQNGFEKTKLLGDKHLKHHSKYSSGHLRCQL